MHKPIKTTINLFIDKLDKIGKEINCKIDMVSQHGIFSGFKNLKVLIPISNLDKWSFDASNNSFKKLQIHTFI